MDLNKLSDRGVFLVNSLAILYNPKLKKILIGKRVNDPFIKELSWCFPGGRPDYKNSLEGCLLDEIKKKTSISKVKVENLFLFARTAEENKQFLLLYYFCTTSEVKAVAGEKFVEVKWVKPAEVRKFFTTSIHPKVLKFLKTL